MKNLTLFLTIVLFVFGVGQSVDAQNHPVAQNDTLDFTFPIEEDTIYLHDILLSNDYWPDSIEVNFFLVSLSGFTGGIITDTVALISNEIVNSHFASTGLVKLGRYFIKDCNSSTPDTSYLSDVQAEVYCRIKNHNNDTIDVNNISALINNFGNQFWNLENNHFEVPKGDSVHSMFCASLWMGGLDEDSSLHFAGQRYRLGSDFNSFNMSADFWAGPISDTYDKTYDMRWNHNIWKVNKEDILYHKNHWQEVGYNLIESIETWPGNGDTQIGQAEQLAPYFDNDNNGIYEPLQGDYPIIRGDQTVFYIFNDGRDLHNESLGTPLGIEVHAMAYAYANPNDTALYNTLFFHYDIYNRSDTAYTNTYLGLFADMDLGYADDDYIGCNVDKGFFYTYNRDGVDESPYIDDVCYGENAPVQGVLFIAGPTIDQDNIDNVAYEGDCSVFDFEAPDGNANKGYAINGMNFGDGVVDNERFGMSGFHCFNNAGASYMQDPRYAIEYYNYLQAKWLDNTNMIYGGNAHIMAGGYGPEAKFMFPGESDSCFWGTGGNEPNGSVNWTEETAGNPSADRRGVGVSGPFTFEVGSKEQFDIAYVFARGEINGISSEDQLIKYVDIIRAKAESNQLDMEQPEEVIGIDEPAYNHQNVKIYPNPSQGILHIQGLDSDINHYKIYDLTGRVMNEGSCYDKTLRLKNFETGFYILRIETDGQIY
ncbi:MAG: T9SS type A sorting domain-containing protein, partial [Bacteroidota bacterium]|nr:T9SS type A sorting domain-containing protein [Bacteroidota bacterium]